MIQKYSSFADQNATSISKQNIIPEKSNGQKFSFLLQAYRKLHQKELVKDTVFDFEKKRNEPVVYNRDLYINTVAAI